MKTFSPAVALLLSSTSAFADITPQDVLQSWRGFYAGFGATISSDTPEVADGITRFTNLRTDMNMINTEAHYNFSWVDMKSNADGSVDITFSPEGNASTLSKVSGGNAESQISYDLSALTIHSEGTPGDIRYSYNAPVITIHQSQNLPDVDISMTIALENWQGTALSVDDGEGLVSDSAESTFDSLSAKVVFEPRRENPVYLDYIAESISVAYDVSLPRTPPPDAPQLSDFYLDGMVFGLSLNTGPATTTVDQKTSKGDGRFSFIQSSGEITTAFAENALSYGFTAMGANLSLVNTPSQPVDFTAAFERAHLGFTMPVRKADAPAPFALAMALEGFTMGEEIWARFDPEATLSHAPAGFSFSVNGTMKLFVDLMDQTAVMAIRGAPFELRSLSLSSLNLQFEGMGLTGIGDLIFDNERTDPISGMPEPNGVLEFSIDGALGMLDKIGRLGFIEPLAIIGAKGALGMFATPNASADSFSSRIEFTEGGHVSVNGQQVK